MKKKSSFLKKITYVTGIVTMISIIAYIIFNLFVYSTPPDNDLDYYQKMKKDYVIYSPKIPDKVSFAGENVPLERYDVRRDLDYEMLKIMYWHSETILYIKRKDAFFSVVEPILKKNGIPDDFKYLMVTESGMINVTSPAKAQGYWQFLGKTAKQYKLEVNNEVDERNNLVKSTEAACKYLLDSYRVFKNWTLVAASYNAGRDKIKKELLRQKVSSYYDLLLIRETSRYLYRIIAFKTILSNPRDYGFNIREKDCYKFPEVKTIEVDTPITSLIDFAIQNHTTYKSLKELNPWLISDNLPNASNKKYKIKILKK